MSFLDVANSGIVWALVVAVVGIITGIAVMFMRKAWVRGLELGYTQAELKNVMKATVSYSLVPSIAIVVGLFSLAAMVGLPWGWYRLSVLGSVTYEIMAASTALKAIGVDIASATATDFVTIAFVMSICILGGLVTSIFIGKKLQEGTMKLKAKDPRWGPLGNSTLMLTLVVVFMVPMILAGGVTLLTMLTSAVTTVIMGIIIKKTKAAWLTEFVLAIALIVAMGSSIMWTGLLK